MPSLRLTHIACTLTVLSVFAGAAGSAWAETQWQADHPRRAEVNKRLANQKHRVAKDVANGTMTQDQAQQIRQEDQQIRQEERAMAGQNGGHITKSEQKALNQQENAVSGQIHSQGGN